MNRLAKRLVLLPPKFAQQVAVWLLARANGYRSEVDSEGVVYPWPWKFPRHQSGFQWTRGGLDGMGDFTELRVYRIDATFSADGSRMVAKRPLLLRGFGIRRGGPRG
jgi:hypothetical protein